MFKNWYEYGPDGGLIYDTVMLNSEPLTVKSVLLLTKTV